MDPTPDASSRPRRTRRLFGWLLASVVVLAGCTAHAAVRAPEDADRGAPPAVRSTGPDRSRSAPRPTAPEPIPDARVGTPAASTRIRFIPHQLQLSKGPKAAVETASTVDGELKVPEDVRHLGWWDGGSQAGEPFGSIVIAGHVDSKTQGLGFFAKLLAVRKGQKITLRGEGHHLTYRVRSISTVKKGALAADNAAFGQTDDHRLVLITCTGAYRVGQGGYDSNLVVIATPIGYAK